ncbi:polymeric immunoglobulin receptor-like [Polypterus senegalus]|uniref:polymeric immunoglobulin receptor-like n=1 Tax=Polypterus senegalus TaxID=55291 RepID=UPI00196688B5|nr:polymeric immunoglobulin receptor-like [Polypterus senegalus]
MRHSLSEDRNEVSGWVGGSLSIPCHYNPNDKGHVKYWCKGWQWHSCKIIKQSDSPEKGDTRISIQDDKDRSVFVVSLSGLTKADSGPYWCGIKISEDGAFLRLKVTGPSNLWVDETVITGQEGGSVSIQCYYTPEFEDHMKFLCRGMEWSSCEILVQSGARSSKGNVTLRDDKKERVFTVSLSKLEIKESGYYWCAVEKRGVKKGTSIDFRIFVQSHFSIENSFDK